MCFQVLDLYPLVIKISNMKKTLLVTYTPRTGSNTKKLVDTFKTLSENRTELSILDLSIMPPSLLLSSELNTFIKANYSGEQLTPTEQSLLNKNNEMTQQVKQADFIVVAYPVYNFSLPATVKAWLDAIIQKDKTFTLNNAGFQGLCTNKKALILTTAGYEIGEADMATPLMKNCLGFMGIESESVVVYGLNQYPENIETLLDQSFLKIAEVCNSWYS